VLRIGGCGAPGLVAAGLRLSFDVHAGVDGARKMPDILVEDPESGIKFHCQVSVMYGAKTQVDQSRLVDQIFRLLALQPRTSRFRRTPSAADCRCGDRRKRADDLASWALRRRGLEIGSFIGTLPDLDGARGLQLRGDEKVTQLPAGLPNLLVVAAPDLFLFAMSLRSVRLLNRDCRPS
jgi:hypothetical protein